MASEATADRQVGTNAATTNHTVDLPTNLSAGDIIHIAFSVDSNSTSVGVPTGYDKPVDLSPHVVITREADGSEGASITVTTGSSVVSAFVSRRIVDGDYAGIETAAEPSDGSETNDANPDPPNLAPSGGSDDYLWIASFGCYVSARTFNSYPTDYGEGETAQENGDTRVASATRSLTASSEDPGTFSLTSNVPWVAVTTSIPPAAGVDPATIIRDSRSDTTFTVEKTDGAPASEIDHSAALVDGVEVENPISLPVGGTYQFTGLDPGTEHDLSIVDYAEADESDGGTESNVLTDETLPSTPDRLEHAPENLFADPLMRADDDGDGVVNGFTVFPGGVNADTEFDLDREAQRLELVTSSDNASFFVEGVVPVTPDAPHRFRYEYETEGLTAGVTPQLLVFWRDDNEQPIDDEGLDLSKVAGPAEGVTGQLVAPTNAADARVLFNLSVFGSGQSGKAWVRKAMGWRTDDVEVELSRIQWILMPGQAGVDHRIYYREAGSSEAYKHVDLAWPAMEATAAGIPEGITLEYFAVARLASGLESAPTELQTVVMGGDRPAKPVVQETHDDLSASLELSDYFHPFDRAHQATHIQIDHAGDDFASPIVDVTLGDVEEYDTGDVLPEATDLEVRAQYEDELDQMGAWSDAVAFKTAPPRPTAVSATVV